jgi:hypothetical protein
MSTLTVSQEYGALLKKVPPKVIRTELRILRRSATGFRGRSRLMFCGF